MVALLIVLNHAHSQNETIDKSIDSLSNSIDTMLSGEDSVDLLNDTTLKKTDIVNPRPLPFLAGDAIQITVYPDTTSFPSGIYPVDGDGYIDLPVIGYLKVTNMSSDNLYDTLKTTFAELLRYPYIKIRPLTRITFMGGFRRPGDYWIDPHYSLWQAMQMAGSTIRSDGLVKLRWQRDKEAVSKDLVTDFQSGKSLYQLGFRSGDQIYVTSKPERNRWEVFRTEILPVLTITMTTLLTAASIYQTYRLMRYGDY